MKKEIIIATVIFLIAVCGFMEFLYALGFFKHPEKKLIPKMVVRVTVKDSVETRKLQVLCDSLSKENKILDQIIHRKKSNVSQILINNEINKEKVLSASDSTVIYLLDSLLSNGKIGFIQALPKGYRFRLEPANTSEEYESAEDWKRRHPHY